MKTVSVNFTDSNLGVLGRAGEHNNTELVFVLTDELLNCDLIIAELGTSNGEKIPVKGECNDENKTFTIKLTRQTTVEGLLTLQLVGCVVQEGSEEPQIIAKSPVVCGNIAQSINGAETEADSNPSLLQRIWAKIEALAKKMHDHKNKETLDNLSPETMKLLKDGAVVKSIDITTDENNSPIMRLELMRQYADYEKFYFFNLPLLAYEETYSGDGDEARLGVNLDIGLTNYKPMPQVEGEIGSAYGSYGNTFIYPNVHYDFGKVDILHILLNEGDLGYVNDYNFSFIADELTIFSLPYEVNWGNDNEIVIEGGKRYEVSIVNNVALWTSAAVEAVTE